jgi:hypothetical protein
VPHLVTIQLENERMRHTRQNRKLPVGIGQLAIRIEAVFVGSDAIVFAARNERLRTLSDKERSGGRFWDCRCHGLPPNPKSHTAQSGKTQIELPGGYDTLLTK